MSEDYIDIGLIDEDPTQVRRRTETTELASTISEVGLLQPILVRKQGERYTVVDGHRRLQALKQLGIQSLTIGKSVIVDESRDEQPKPIKAKRDDKGRFIPEPIRMNGPSTMWTLNAHEVDDTADAKFKQLIANVQREDLNPMELGRAFVALKEYGYYYNDLARMLGTNQHYIYEKVGLVTRLTPEMQALVVSDWEIAKAKRDAGVDPGYTVQVLVVQDIARLPAELQQQAYEAIKTGEMERQRALWYLGDLKKQHEESKPIEVKPNGEARKKVSHLTPLTRCLRKVVKSIDLLDEVAGTAEADPATTTEAIDGLIERLRELRTKVANRETSEPAATTQAEP